ncbi:MAG: SGNH/GDSL hydrolase family protein [Anaerolineaceae bacterium]|nr:SGNH/GDSL hydrolase family protein [Anaerolineaceae bacterium]
MKTTYEMTPTRQERLLRIARETPCTNGRRPETFIRLLQTNTGLIGALTRSGLDEHGLERKNPLIVALGDSVTAGHFENLFPLDNWHKAGEMIARGEPLEIVDLRQVYHEQFRLLLAEKFGVTSLSVINAGIAGDSILGMYRRVYRDVIRYQPDLVILNGSLNWGDFLGAPEDFRRGLAATVQAIKANTQAEIILLTPNPIAEPAANAQLAGRVENIRALAGEEQVALVDVYRLWQEFSADMAEVAACLANGLNHPTAVGHQVYALALMQLF